MAGKTNLVRYDNRVAITTVFWGLTMGLSALPSIRITALMVTLYLSIQVAK